MSIEVMIAELEREFRRILYDTPQVLLRDLKVGDHILHICTPQRVTKLTSKHVVTTHDKHPLYWQHQTVNRITEADARYIVGNWMAYSIWMIHGTGGLHKAAIAAQVPTQSEQLTLFEVSE